MRWAIIENAGYERERVLPGEFESQSDAWRYAWLKYDNDEMEDLHVDVAHWDPEGFWSYDH